MVASLALSGLVVFWYMAGLFVVALLRRNNTIADAGWALAFLFPALAVLWYHQPVGFRPILVTVLVAVWAVRLCVHILLRNWGKGEDRWHRQWRRQWGAWWALRSFVQVFLLQGAVALVIVAPALYVNTYGGPPLAWIDMLGAGVWLFGFLFETVADYQLTRFTKHPENHGRILQSGLWKYSRHPNYFGEILQWWGIWCFALVIPGGWITVVGPLSITFLILKVSGVPLQEARLREHPEFEAYAKQTSPLIPWFSKKKNPASDSR
jgi:steroid 5-alpha reductase family enzyme